MDNNLDRAGTIKRRIKGPVGNIITDNKHTLIYSRSKS